jgi:hypothetical protein
VPAEWFALAPLFFEIVCLERLIQAVSTSPASRDLISDQFMLSLVFCHVGTPVIAVSDPEIAKHKVTFFKRV